MKAKLVTLLCDSAIRLGGCADGKRGQTGDRIHKGRRKNPLARQIEVLSETSEYRLVKHPSGRPGCRLRRGGSSA